MTRGVSPIKLQKGLAFSPLSSVGGWSDFTFSVFTFSICANLSFNSKKQFTLFLKLDLRINCNKVILGQAITMAQFQNL